MAEEAIDPLLNAIWEADFELRKNANTSLFKAALDRIYMAVSGARDEWDQQTPEEGAVIPVECAREFYRVFSALKYIYCLPLERGQGEYDNFDLFGDGMMWAGMSIIHFLGQRKRYDSFDFADYLLRVAEVFPVDPTDKPSTSFLANASRMRDLCGTIFRTLDNYVPEYQPYVVQIHPPVDDSDVSQFKITSTRAVDDPRPDATYVQAPVDDYDYYPADIPIPDRKSTRLNSSHRNTSRMPSSA